MHYLIDGYNLLFRLLHKGEEVQKARDEMIEDLSLKITYTELNATLVFDSKYQEGDVSRTFERGLEIVYTDKGETADEWIISEVKRAPISGLEQVVTSDKRLAAQVRIKGGQAISCEDFMTYLQKKVLLERKSQLAAKEKAKEPSESVAKISPPSKLILRKRVVKESKEHYLEVFEKKFEAETKPLEKKANPSSSNKSKPVKKKEQKVQDKRPGETEDDRWARLFGV